MKGTSTFIQNIKGCLDTNEECNVLNYPDTRCSTVADLKQPCLCLHVNNPVCAFT